MFYYSIYGLKVESDCPLNAAHAVPSFEMYDVRIHKGELPYRLVQETKEEQAAGKNNYYYRYGHSKGWVRAVGQGSFLMQNGNEIIYQLKPEHDPLWVGEALLCLCLGVLMAQRQTLMMHGSAVCWQGQAIAIGGQSGAGKSTLAYGLLQCKGQFMADDAIALCYEQGRAMVLPGYPQQKLCGDTAVKMGLNLADLTRLPDEGGREKYALPQQENFAATAKPLAALVLLQIGEDEPGSIEEITGAEKLKNLLNNLYKPTMYSQIGIKPETFMQAVKIADAIKILKLTRPRAGMAVEDEINLLQQALYGKQSV